MLVMSNAAVAQIREIRTTGEYRMGDNDTRADAKRLALLDAKRAAIEQAGTFLASSTQVQNFKLTKDQIEAYAAGITQVIEQGTRATMDGDTMVIRVDALVRINVEDMVRRIDDLRKNSATSDQVLEMQKQMKALEEQVQSQTKQIATLTSKADVDRATAERQQALAKVDSRQLLAQAWVALVGSLDSSFIVGSTSIDGRVQAKRLAEQALQADPNLADAHYMLSRVLGEDKRYQEAEREARLGLRQNPTAAGHNELAIVLQNEGRIDEAIAEYRLSLQMNPNSQISHYNLAVALEDQGRPVEAAMEYRESLRINPGFAGAHYAYGDCLRKLGNRAGAMYELREYLRLAGDNPALKDKVDRARAMLTELSRP